MVKQSFLRKVYFIMNELQMPISGIEKKMITYSEKLVAEN